MKETGRPDERDHRVNVSTACKAQGLGIDIVQGLDAPRTKLQLLITYIDIDQEFSTILLFVVNLFPDICFFDCQGTLVKLQWVGCTELPAWVPNWSKLRATQSVEVSIFFILRFTDSATKKFRTIVAYLFHWFTNCLRLLDSLLHVNHYNYTITRLHLWELATYFVA